MERLFKLSANQTTVRTEVLAGVTTFLTMAYIIFVQPAVLSGKMFGTDTGLEFGAVTTATCVSAALATAIMALYAQYPIAQAPGMGENFFFVFSALPAATAAGFGNGWQVALGVVFVSGVLFLILSLIGLRELIFNSISPSLKNGIAAGIGLFIAFIGLQQAGVIVKDPGTAVRMNAHFASPDLIIFFVGVLTTAVLHAPRPRLNSLGHRSRYCACVSAQNHPAVHAGWRFRGARGERVDACYAFRIRNSDRCSAAFGWADISKNGYRPRADAYHVAVRFCFSFHAHV